MAWRERVLVCSVYAWLLGCTDYNVTATASTGTAVPGGDLVQIDIKGNDDLGGIAVTLSALPSTITVSPPTVTLDSNGDAVAQALVPYGVSGTVLVAGAFTNTIPVSVVAPPVTLCPIVFAAKSDQSSDGQLYGARVHVVTDTCQANTKAPAGIPITFSVMQPGAAAVSTMVFVDGSGDAELPVVVPWGKSLVVIATGGGAAVSGTQFGAANPAVVKCLTWTVTGNVYSVTAKVTGLALASVMFSIAPVAGGVVSPTPLVIDSNGMASSTVAVADIANLPTVEAAAGNSSLAEVLTAAPKTMCP